MAPEQVRLSGVNYFYVNRKIGNTGRYLEKFLNLFDCTVYPCKRNCVYHTEIVHSFPRYVVKNGRKSIRRPSSKEIFESVKSNILSDEIELRKYKFIEDKNGNVLNEPIDAYNHCIDAMRYVSIMKLANQQKIQIIDRGRLGI